MNTLKPPPLSFPTDATTGASSVAAANYAATENTEDNATVLTGTERSAAVSTGTGRSAAAASVVARLEDAAVTSAACCLCCSRGTHT
jgi:hypothetical protein